MSINVCCHIYNFEFVYENINNCLSDDHIWNYLTNLVRYVIQIFRIFFTYQLLSNDRRLKVEIVMVSNFAFSGVCQLSDVNGRLEYAAEVLTMLGKSRTKQFKDTRIIKHIKIYNIDKLHQDM